jgi:hypothetical protein
MVAGAISYRQLHEFIRTHRQRLNDAFKLSLRHAPSYTGLRLILQGIEPVALEEAFRRHAASIEGPSSALRPTGPYCAAKAAIRGFVDSLRTELLWEKSAVHVTMVHLPAVNTPQFDWARTKFRRKLAPVAPIYQPETVADAVFRAVRTKPREYWLGFSTVKAIVAQMLAPGLADRYLADAGKSSETVNQPAEIGRPDNMFDAGVGDPGTRGRFDDRSSQQATAVDPKWLRVGLAVIGLGAIAAFLSAADATKKRALESKARA